MKLPYHVDLPVNRLAACFNNTVATYKFYWFLSIIGRIEAGESHILKRHLFADMMAASWFTVNYFHVSFGKLDKIQLAVQRLMITEDLTVDADRKKVFNKLVHSNNIESNRILQHFNAEVPHRFLSPWFNAENKRSAYLASQTFINGCLYALLDDHILINPDWMSYLLQNAGILKAFCYWNLAVYLQSKNPNVPDIPNKLIKAPVRKGLTAQRTQFWDIVIRELGGVNCIYTDRRLPIGGYAVEHFIPYAFVSHDLIWNLIPADPSFNAGKSDKLPSLDKYFEPYFKLQQQAVEIISFKQPQNKFLQEYLTLFPSIAAEHFNYQRFYEQVQPLITIAGNNGFEMLT